MNVKKMFLIGLASLGMLLACDKENDVAPENNLTVAQDGTNYFALDLQSYMSDGDTLIEVYFSASDVSELPLLVINGDTASTYHVYGSMIYVMEDFPYAEYVEYAISAKGKTTSGGIAMPKTPQLSCNGIVLESDSELNWDLEEPDTIPLADHYNFNWTSGDQPDYYTLSYNFYESGYYSDREFPNGNNMQLVLEPNEIIRFYFSAYNGVLIQPGARPNFSGAYGKGYVTAASFVNRPYMIIPENEAEMPYLKSSMVSEKQETIRHQPYTIEEVLRIVNQ